MAKPFAPLPRVANAPVRPRPTAASAPPKKSEKEEKPQKAPANEERPKKAPAKKKSAIDTALKSATLLDKHARRLALLAANWEGEATLDQQTTNNEVVRNATSVAKLAQQIALDVDMLKTSGFHPIAARQSGPAIVAGAKVVIKAKFYEPAVHGAANNFEVVVVVGKFVRLRGPDPKQPQVVALRSWIEAVDEVEVDDTPPEDPETEGATGSEDPDLDDHRLPNEDELE